VLALPVLPDVSRGLGRELALAAPVSHVLVQRLPMLDQHRAVRGLKGALVAGVLHALVDRLQVALQVVAPGCGVLALVAEKLGILVGVPVLPEAACAPRGELADLALEEVCGIRGVLAAGTAATVAGGSVTLGFVFSQFRPLGGLEKAATALIHASFYTSWFLSRFPANVSFHHKETSKHLNELYEMWPREATG
jgi:hypothetical protein